MESESTLQGFGTLFFRVRLILCQLAIGFRQLLPLLVIQLQQVGMVLVTSFR